MPSAATPTASHPLCPSESLGPRSPTARQKQRAERWQELAELQACPVPTRIGDCVQLA